MRYMYDCEFLEDGKTIDLISIGIVAEDGREYCAVSTQFDTRRVASNWWIMENVMSSIKHDKFVVADFDGAPMVRDIWVTDPAAKDRCQIAYDIWEFCCKDDKETELWAWYSAYDHVCLAQLFGLMIDLPKGMPMTTFDIKQLHKQAGYCAMPKQPAGLHNALEDARFNVVRYNYLMSVLNA